MVSKPRFASEANHVNGLAAVALFLVLAAVILTSSFPDPQGFPAGASIVASIGYAMFNLQPDGIVQSEQFLVAFEIIDVLLVAALVAAVMLARREGLATAIEKVTDGGRDRDDRGRDESDTAGGDE